MAGVRLVTDKLAEEEFGKHLEKGEKLEQFVYAYRLPGISATGAVGGFAALSMSFFLALTSKRFLFLELSMNSEPWGIKELKFEDIKWVLVRKGILSSTLMFVDVGGKNYPMTIPNFVSGFPRQTQQAEVIFDFCTRFAAFPKAPFFRISRLQLEKTIKTTVIVFVTILLVYFVAKYARVGINSVLLFMMLQTLALITVVAKIKENARSVGIVSGLIYALLFWGLTVVLNFFSRKLDVIDSVSTGLVLIVVGILLGYVIGFIWGAVTGKDRYLEYPV